MVESVQALSKEELSTIALTDIEKKAKLFIAKSSIFEIETNNNEESEKLLALFQVQIKIVIETLNRTQKEPTSQVIINESDHVQQAQRRRVIKRKFITSKKSQMTFKCPYCDKVFQYIQSLGAHVKVDHPDEKKILSKDFGEDEDLTRCLMKNKKTGGLCNKLFPKHQMARHLKSHPEAESQPPKKKFKGFLTSDNGESYEVVWRGPREENPPSEEEIEVSDVENNEEQDGAKSKQVDGSNLDVEGNAKDKTIIAKIQVDPSSRSEVLFSDSKVPDIAKVQQERPVSKVVVEVNKVLANNMMFEDSLHSKLDVVMTEAAVKLCEDEDGPNLFDSQPHTSPPEPTVFVEIESQSSIVNIEDLETNSSFGIIKTQESELMDFSFGDDVLEDPDQIEESIIELADLSSKSRKRVKIKYFTTKVKRGQFSCAFDINYNSNNPVKANNEENRNVIGEEEEDGSDSTDEDDTEDDKDKEGTEDGNDNEEDGGGDDGKNNGDTDGNDGFDKDNEGGDDDRNNNDLENSEDEDIEEENFDCDSDFEEDDEEEYTNHRLEMKKVRQMKRNTVTAGEEISDRPGNVDFIKSFQEFLVRQCNDGKKSTVVFTMGHMFNYNDSWLNFMTSKDKNFLLDRLLDFKNSGNFVTLSSPMNWLAVTGGPTGKDQPSRQLEQLKAHARFRNYLEFKVNEENFDGEGIIKKLAFVQNNAAISTEIERLKIRNKLNKWYNFEKNKKRKMRQILNPEVDINILEAVKTWFNSDVSKEKEAEAVSIWKKTIKSKPQLIKEKDFMKVAMLARFTTAVCDKLRPGAYKFKNTDYEDKVAVYFPEDMYEEIWSIENLPANCKLYSPPHPAAEPKCYEIRLDGNLASLKGEAPVTLIINKRCHQLNEMYLDLKRIVSKSKKEVIEMEDPFYVNFKLEKLSRLQWSKGNLLDLFGKVTNIPRFKMTDLRKAQETIIQSRSDLAKIGKDLNCHNANVVPAYDHLSSTRRMIFVSTLNDKEGSSSVALIDDDEDEVVKDHLKERKSRETEEGIKRKKEAKKFLENEKLNKKVVDLTPYEFSEEVLTFLQTIFVGFNLQGLIIFYSIINYTHILFSRLRHSPAEAEILQDLGQ